MEDLPNATVEFVIFESPMGKMMLERTTKPKVLGEKSLGGSKYGSGKFSLAELAAPAVTLARAGLEVSDDLADSLPLAQARFKRWPSSARIFLHADGTALSRGDRLVQTDLASVLEAIGRDGEIDALGQFFLEPIKAR